MAFLNVFSNSILKKWRCFKGRVMKWSGRHLLHDLMQCAAACEIGRRAAYSHSEYAALRPIPATLAPAAGAGTGPAACAASERRCLTGVSRRKTPLPQPP